jgi:LPS O-antigen subunit length determinant protein (WzzB/FepE family)
MSDDYYYHGKKIKFKSLFNKDADENLSQFLQYISIEINREMLGELDELTKSIKELTQSNYDACS